MATKIERIWGKINDSFSAKLAEAVATRFRRLRVETRWNIFSMVHITERKDGKPFTREQTQFLKGFESGYLAARDQVQEEAK
jgi:hypothetical protein